MRAFYKNSIAEETEKCQRNVSYVNELIYSKTGYSDLIILKDEVVAVINKKKYSEQDFLDYCFLINEKVCTMWELLSAVINEFYYEEFYNGYRCNALDYFCEIINLYIDREEYIDEMMNDYKYM